MSTMNDAEKRREEIRAAWQKHVAPRRHSKKAPMAPVGFDYGKAIERISRARKSNGYTLQQIADCMGVTEPMVKKYKRGDRIPDHIGGEALRGLYDDVFGKGLARRDLVRSEHLEDWNAKRILK